MKKPDLYQTSDLALASFLSAAGFLVEATQKEDSSNRVLFFFERTAGLDDLIQAFWRRGTTIEPQVYFQAIKLLKARIYGE